MSDVTRLTTPLGKPSPSILTNDVEPLATKELIHLVGRDHIRRPTLKLVKKAHVTPLVTASDFHQSQPG